VTRTTRAELEQLAAIITHALECQPDAACTGTANVYAIEYAYGRPRLVRAGGSVDVSPRLPAGELATWCRAFLDGIDAERRRTGDTITVSTVP
jgi:hypothetical protein